MELSFTGKIALVTGAGSGIGAATALLYAEYGAKVIVADTSEKEGNDTVARIKSKNGEATFIRMGLSSLTACSLFIRKVARGYGRIDIACNNASVFHESQYAANKNPETFNNEMDFDLNSLFYCMKYEIETMQKQDMGIIVNIAPVPGSLGLVAFSPYVNLKYGVIELMQNPTGESLSGGIRIHAITPAFMNTSLWENAKTAEKTTLIKLSSIDRLGKMEAVAKLAILPITAPLFFFP